MEDFDRETYLLKAGSGGLHEVDGLNDFLLFSVFSNLCHILLIL